MYDVDIVIALVMQVETLSKNIDGLTFIKQQAPIIHYDLYGGGHGNQVCQAVESMRMPNRHVDYIINAPRPQKNLYSNTYNLSWRN